MEDLLSREHYCFKIHTLLMKSCFYSPPSTGNLPLKVVSATFLLVSFLSVKESTYQTKKSVFYFTSKALSVLEKIKF